MMGVGGVQTRWYQGLLSPRTKKIKGRTKPSSVHEAKTAEQWAAVLVGIQNGTSHHDRSPNSSQANSMGVGDWEGGAQTRPGENMICFAAILNPISHPGRLHNNPGAFRGDCGTGETPAEPTPQPQPRRATVAQEKKKTRLRAHPKQKQIKTPGFGEENPPPVSLTARRARGGGSPPRCRPASGSHHQPRHGRTG